MDPSDATLLGIGGTLLAAVIAAMRTQPLQRPPPPSPTPAPPPSPPLRHGPHHSFHSRVAGVSFRNDDGTSRQAAIAACHAGEAVHLVCDPGNRYDSNAVKVCRCDGRQIGHLPTNHGLADDVAANRVTAAVEDIGRPNPDAPLGVVLLITVYDA